MSCVVVEMSVSSMLEVVVVGVSVGFGPVGLGFWVAGDAIVRKSLDGMVVLDLRIPDPILILIRKNGARIDLEI